MDRAAVLLRGINVGGGNRLPMADLRAVLEGIGCQDVRTYLQSGNAVVTADVRGLAARVEEALPLKVSVVVLTAAEVLASYDGCPWPQLAAEQPKQVHVLYVDRLPSPARLEALGHQHGDDEVVIGDRWLYLRYTSTSLDSPLNAALDKPPLGVVLTTRNWRTVTKLAELVAPV